MIRLILRLLNIRDYDTCKSCETLKQQLDFERAEKKQLTETLLNIISPKVIEATPVVLAPVSISGGTFARRRAALEERDRIAAQTYKEAKHIGKPDDLKDIEKLETELGVEEKEA